MSLLRQPKIRDSFVRSFFTYHHGTICFIKEFLKHDIYFVSASIRHLSQDFLLRHKHFKILNIFFVEDYLLSLGLENFANWAVGSGETHAEEDHGDDG